jgi:DNA-binding response OmpR family regulator
VASTHPDVIHVGELTIHRSDGLVSVDGRTLTLSIREFGLLLALADAQGRILTREQLYREVWGKPLAGGDRSVDVYVHKLRAKLDSARPGASFIHTHVGFGYRLSREPANGSSRSATVW